MTDPAWLKEISEDVLTHWVEIRNAVESDEYLSYMHTGTRYDIRGYTEDFLKKKDLWISSENCAYCEEFYDKKCDGCPIFRKTEFEECFDTPYWEVKKEIENPEPILEDHIDKVQKAIETFVTYLKDLMIKQQILTEKEANEIIGDIHTNPELLK